MANAKISKSLFWKLLERFGVQGGQFVLQIILARILDPEHYGVLSLLIIFTTLANVFIQNGFNTSLIQNKDVKEEDYSSVFWVTMGIAFLLYGVLYILAPWIAEFYQMPEIIAPFRVLALILFPGALNSVQIAKVSRELDFKKIFISNIGGILISGVVGVVIAYCDGGLWALVIQTLTNTMLTCIIMFFTVKWRPRFLCNFSRVKVLFSFGWKLLVSSLLEALYQDLRSLIIGKKYSSETLGFYNRGKQFPQFIINAINGSLRSVMLSAMSAEQENKEQVKQLTRTSIALSAYLIFPFMAGLAAVAPAMIKLLLTEKWLPCVPYLQIYCISQAFAPIHSCNLQAINAMGRSDLYLILEVIKKVIGVASLVFAVFCFDSPIAIALTGIFTAVISFFVNAAPNKKLIGYSYLEQLKDLLPQILMSVFMGITVYCVNLLRFDDWITLLVQVPFGVMLYLGLSHFFRVEAFNYVMTAAKSFLKKKV